MPQIMICGCTGYGLTDQGRARQGGGGGGQLTWTAGVQDDATVEVGHEGRGMRDVVWLGIKRARTSPYPVWVYDGQGL